jgi:hypothetical protein
MGEKKILRIDVKRSGTKTLLKLQGDINFSLLNHSPVERFKIGGVTCIYWSDHVKLNGVLLNQSETAFNAWASPLNLSLLQAEDLSGGVEVELNFPIRTDQLKKVAQVFKDAAKELYLNYVRPVDIEVEVCANEKEVMP